MDWRFNTGETTGERHPENNQRFPCKQEVNTFVQQQESQSSVKVSTDDMGAWGIVFAILIFLAFGAYVWHAMFGIKVSWKKK